MMSQHECPQPSSGLQIIWSGLEGYFLPNADQCDVEARNRARTFLMSHLFGPPLGLTVPLALYLLDPAPTWDVALLATSIAFFWIFPFLLRRGVAYERLVILSVANLNFCTLFSCYANGGITSSTLVWILLIPMLSLFYVGGDRKLQPLLMTILAMSIGLAFLGYMLVPPPAKEIPDLALQIFGAISLLAMLCYVAMMAIYYARVYDAGLQLEIEASRRRELLEQLRKAIIAAHRSGSAKAEFFARMRHDIRTPINEIVDYAQKVEENTRTSGDAMLREDLQRIHEAARYLVRLVDMVLDLAEIVAGRMRFDVGDHEVTAMIDDAVNALGSPVEGGRGTVEIVVDAAPVTFGVDRRRLLQILHSVLSNAVKHTRNGQVHIAARVTGANRLTISITDEGEGIEPHALGTLFDVFVTERHAADGRYGGTGLSLAVCAQLCRAMGGSIAVQSVRGEGSTFTISLPLRADAM